VIVSELINRLLSRVFEPRHHMDSECDRNNMLAIERDGVTAMRKQHFERAPANNEREPS